jgi:hypothetical protein
LAAASSEQAQVTALLLWSLRTLYTRASSPHRFIESITELGVVPPAGAGLYGYAALPLTYAAQHLAPLAGKAAMALIICTQHAFMRCTVTAWVY